MLVSGGDSGVRCPVFLQQRVALRNQPKLLAVPVELWQKLVQKFI